MATGAQDSGKFDDRRRRVGKVNQRQGAHDDIDAVVRAKGVVDQVPAYHGLAIVSFALESWLICCPGWRSKTFWLVSTGAVRVRWGYDVPANDVLGWFAVPGDNI
jgi:hypothetical protein